MFLPIFASFLFDLLEFFEYINTLSVIYVKRVVFYFVNIFYNIIFLYAQNCHFFDDFYIYVMLEKSLNETYRLKSNHMVFINPYCF